MHTWVPVAATQQEIRTFSTMTSYSDDDDYLEWELGNLGGELECEGDIFLQLLQSPLGSIPMEAPPASAPAQPAAPTQSNALGQGGSPSYTTPSPTSAGQAVLNYINLDLPWAPAAAAGTVASTSTAAALALPYSLESSMCAIAQPPSEEASAAPVPAECTMWHPSKEEVIQSMAAAFPAPVLQPAAPPAVAPVPKRGRPTKAAVAAAAAAAAAALAAATAGRSNRSSPSPSTTTNTTVLLPSGLPSIAASTSPTSPQARSRRGGKGANDGSTTTARVPGGVSKTTKQRQQQVHLSLLEQQAAALQEQFAALSLERVRLARVNAAAEAFLIMRNYQVAFIASGETAGIRSLLSPKSTSAEEAVAHLVDLLCTDPTAAPDSGTSNTTLPTIPTATTNTMTLMPTAAHANNVSAAGGAALPSAGTMAATVAATAAEYPVPSSTSFAAQYACGVLEQDDFIVGPSADTVARASAGMCSLTGSRSGYPRPPIVLPSLDTQYTVARAAAAHPFAARDMPSALQNTMQSVPGASEESGPAPMPAVGARLLASAHLTQHQHLHMQQQQQQPPPQNAGQLQQSGPKPQGLHPALRPQQEQPGLHGGSGHLCMDESSKQYIRQYCEPAVSNAGSQQQLAHVRLQTALYRLGLQAVLPPEEVARIKNPILFGKQAFADRWKAFVWEHTEALLQYEMTPDDAAAAVLATAAARGCVLFKTISMHRPDLIMEIMAINLETGESEAASDGHWLNVIGHLRLDSAQRSAMQNVYAWMRRPQSQPNDDVLQLLEELTRHASPLSNATNAARNSSDSAATHVHAQLPQDSRQRSNSMPTEPAQRQYSSDPYNGILYGQADADAAAVAQGGGQAAGDLRRLNALSCDGSGGMGGQRQYQRSSSAGAAAGSFYNHAPRDFSSGMGGGNGGWLPDNQLRSAEGQAGISEDGNQGAWWRNHKWFGPESLYNSGLVLENEILPALEARLARERVEDLLLRGFLFGTTLTVLQFSKMAVYAYPAFPDARRIVELAATSLP